MKIALALIVAATLSGCAYPAKQVSTVDDRPGIYVAGAPSEAVLFVDGIEMGRAAAFDGNPKILLLEPGTHRLKIIHGADVLLSQDVFLGEGTRRKITLPARTP